IDPELAKVLRKILKPLSEKVRSLVNTDDSIPEIHHISVGGETTLASLDILDLFTSINRRNSMIILTKMLDDDDSWQEKFDSYPEKFINKRMNKEIKLSSRKWDNSILQTDSSIVVLLPHVKSITDKARRNLSKF
ncbi:unnamed protein product, partial [Didymodactylos carnosus]